MGKLHDWHHWEHWLVMGTLGITDVNVQAGAVLIPLGMFCLRSQSSRGIEEVISLHALYNRLIT